MTTAAISEGVVAVDSQLTGGNYALRCAKLVRLPDGGVAVGCGDWATAWAGLCWLVNGERGDPPDLTEAEIAIVRPDGSIWLALEQFPAFPIMDRSYALGCGRDLARKALADGKDPIQAVAEACDLDTNSSAPILSMTACPTHEYPPATAHAVKRRR